MAMYGPGDQRRAIIAAVNQQAAKIDTVTEELRELRAALDRQVETVTAFCEALAKADKVGKNAE